MSRAPQRPGGSRAGRACAYACALVLAGCGGGGGSGSGGEGGNGGGNGGGTPPPDAAIDFRDEIVYQLLTDRFDNGDAANDGGELTRRGDATDLTNPVGWHGGDFAGIRRRIEEGYFSRLGVTALWISPVVLQVAPPGNGGGVNANRPFVGFHGYWADRFDAIEPHFGDLAALRALADAADAAGLELVIDVVVNHTGPGSSILAANPTWFRTGSQCGSDDVTMCLAGLPDFRQEQATVTEFLNGTIAYLQDNVPGLDGLRMDTMKHVGDAYWQQFFADDGVAAPDRLWTVGEIFSGDTAQVAKYVDTLGSPAAFDFPLKFAVTDSLAKGQSTRRLADLFGRDADYDDPTRLATFLDNHDVWRFTSEAEAAGSPADEADRRLDMALTLLYAARGIPVVYYGTEIAMRGRGDSYALPIGQSSREDMQFQQLAQSGFDERLAALAQARQGYEALRRGVQRTLAAPGDSCQPPVSSLSPSADFGDTLYVRGAFDDWANPPSASNRFVNLGSRQYAAVAQLPAGRTEFKVAAADWTPEFSNTAQDTLLATPITLTTNTGAGTNSRLSVATAGCYEFALNASSTTSPVLTVAARDAGTAGLDVFAFARTLTGAHSVVYVVNNQRTAVDLGGLAGGGVDVAGIFPDDAALTEITGNAAAANALRVTGGRLVGALPALTAVVIATR
ncbi:MAG TPA: alpha-amylase family glycosyl hydrolase [Steroidobacteraceae bacterium]|nr:alpha-amylase family glycosyl hydrolase [Steroidobacteraceae bacterium]